MKVLKKIIFIILTFLVLFNPIINYYDFNALAKERVYIICDFNNEEKIKDKILTTGNKIIDEIPELKVIEADVSEILKSELLLKENIYLVKNNKMHISNLNNDYYEEKNNSYYEEKNNSYYEEKNNSYYEEKNNSYYEEKNNILIDEADLFNRFQWDIKDITNEGEIWKIEKGNHNVVIGIIDSGVNNEHSDLRLNFLGGKNFVPRNFEENKNETGNIYDYMDKQGHGTEVAGIIAANGRTKGIAPEVGFKTYRIFDENGNTTEEICAKAIVEAVKDKVDIINLSVEGYYNLENNVIYNGIYQEKIENEKDIYNYLLLKRAIEYAEENNVIVVSCAGNKGINCSNCEEINNYLNNAEENKDKKFYGISYEAPGGIEGVITVGSIDKKEKLTQYSNYGINFTKIVTYGGDIKENKTANELCFTTAKDGQYTFVAGTSYSAPKISAAIALIKCKYPDFSCEEIKNKLLNSTDKKNNEMYYGKGKLNLDKALN